MWRISRASRSSVHRLKPHSSEVNLPHRRPEDKFDRHFLWDLDTDEMTFSDQLKRIWEFGPRRIDVTYEMVGERTHPDDLQAEWHRERVQCGICRQPGYEMRLRMPDGRIKYIWVCARMVRHEGWRDWNVSALFRTLPDVGSRKMHVTRSDQNWRM